jgi:Amt family ammonium transporter
LAILQLVGGIILGPRIGRFHDRDGNPLDEPAEIPPHSTALQFLGTFCLWFGWYGFNPGSVLKVTDYGPVAALAAMNTTLSACAGALSAMFLSSFYDHRVTGVFTYDVVYTMNGCLAGLAAITSGCATVDTWAAVVIGAFAGLFYLVASKLCIYFRFDDAVDAVPVHLAGGLWGMIATGLLSAPNLIEAAYGPSDHAGWFYEWSMGSGDFSLLGAQLVACLFIFGWTFTVMGAWFYLLNFMGWFRVDPLEEEAGLDVSRHKGAGYDIANVSEEVVEQLTVRRSKHVSVTKDDVGIADPASDNGAEKEISA